MCTWPLARNVGAHATPTRHFNPPGVSRARVGEYSGSVCGWNGTRGWAVLARFVVFGPAAQLEGDSSLSVTPQQQQLSAVQARRTVLMREFRHASHGFNNELVQSALASYDAIPGMSMLMNMHATYLEDCMLHHQQQDLERELHMQPRRMQDAAPLKGTSISLTIPRVKAASWCRTVCCI